LFSITSAILALNVFSGYLWVSKTPAHIDTSSQTYTLFSNMQEELEIPYTVKEYARLPSGSAPPELREVHPIGRSPVITDGNVVLAESGAIVGGWNAHRFLGSDMHTTPLSMLRVYHQEVW
jgi:Glutathione S-transferase, N-terminal domain